VLYTREKLLGRLPDVELNLGKDSKSQEFPTFIRDATNFTPSEEQQSSEQLWWGRWGASPKGRFQDLLVTEGLCSVSLI